MVRLGGSWQLRWRGFFEARSSSPRSSERVMAYEDAWCDRDPHDFVLTTKRD